MNIEQYKKIINDSFKELSADIEMYQYVSINPQVNEMVYIYSGNKISLDYKNTPLTTDLFNKNYAIDLKILFHILSRYLSKTEGDKKAQSVFFNIFKDSFPQGSYIPTYLLEKELSIYPTITEKNLNRIENYELPLLEKYVFKSLSNSDLVQVFDFIFRIKDNDESNLFNRDTIKKTLDGFIKNNIKNINTDKKINYVIMKLESNNYYDLVDKYKKLLEYHEELEIYTDKEIVYDSLVLNKESLQRKYGINGGYSIANNLEYQRVFDMIFSKIKSKKHREIFKVNNILLSTFTEKSKEMGIVIVESDGYSKINKEMIKIYFEKSLSIYSRESKKDNKKKFYEIKEMITDELDSLVLKIWLSLKISTENKAKTKITKL